MTTRRQEGTLFAIGDTCYLKYRITELKDGTPQRVHKTIRLCEKSDVHTWWKKKGKWGFSSAIHALRADKMAELRTDIERAEPSKGTPNGDLRVTDFWETRYLPYLEAIVALTGQPRRKPSTVRGFKQIWRQHLQKHFGDITLKAYEPALGNRFLRSLTGTQGKATLKHIKALGSSMFGHAVEEEIIKVNPWREVKIPKDAVESEATPHYTLEEAEDIISALVDHVDCQLVLALACFLGLRPGEIAALKWEDFDTENDLVHIRRSVVRGVVGTPKTPESLAALPLPAQVRIPLELWRQAVERENAERKAEGDVETNGYVFESRNGTPVDLHNLTARVIRPHVEGSHYKLHGKAQDCIRCNKVPKSSGREWKTLYAGRRCAATAVIEANNGNLAIGQALLRHKSQITTAVFYKKAVTPETLRNGIKMLEAAANGK
jgi:integrase